MDQTKAKLSVILVGPGSAFGYELAVEFGLRGHDVILVGRNRQTMKRMSALLHGESINSSIYTVNLADMQSIRATFEEIIESETNIALLIYNAVARRNCRPSVLSAGEAIEDFSISVAGAVEWARLMIPYFLQRHGGSLIFTGGGVALSPAVGAASMSLSKAALRNYVLNLAQELRETAISVGLVTLTEKIGEGDYTPETVAEKFYEIFASGISGETII